MKMLYLKFSDPGRQIPLPFDSSMCTRDTIYREKMDRDNREYRTASVRFILEILGAQAGARLLKRKMVTPALFLVAGGDRIVDSAASEKVFRGLASRDKTLIDFPGMYHSLSIELGKEQVFEEILRGAGKRLAP
jgi:alpha-beta hydrolase superfamily lysophospholipase